MRQNLQKMMGNNTKLNLVKLSMVMCIQNLVRFCQFIAKILRGNETLMSVKGHNSIKIL